MKKIDDLSRNEIENLITQWVLNERNRKIMYRCFIDGVRFEKLAEEFELSVTQVKNIVYKNRTRILQHAG